METVPEEKAFEDLSDSYNASSVE